MMNRIAKIISSVCLVLILAAFCTVSGYAESAEYSILDETNVRFLGRGEVLSDVNGVQSRTFNWPGSGLEFSFTGTKAEIYVHTLKTANTNEKNLVYFNVSVDGAEPTRFALAEGWNTLYTGEALETHTIKFVRSSEANNGTATFTAIRTDGTPNKTAAKAKKIEFIGDSYTAGYASLDEEYNYGSKCAQNTDNWVTYAGITARYFDADANVIAHSGKGLCMNNIGGTGTAMNTTGTMAEQFNYAEVLTSDDYNMSTQSAWDFYKYRPQVVVVFLGINDHFGTNDNVGGGAGKQGEYFTEKYIEFLNNVRTKYPSAHIICVSKSVRCYASQVTAAVEAVGGEARRFHRLIVGDSASNPGGHPNKAEHQAIADLLIEKINSIDNVWTANVNPLNDELMSINIDYNNNEVEIIGSTGAAYDQVSVLALEPDVAYEDATEENIIYFDTKVTGQKGNFSFVFPGNEISGSHTLYFNSSSLNTLHAREYLYDIFVPTLTVTRGNDIVKSMEELRAYDTLTIKLGGFDVGDDFVGDVFVAQYNSSGILTYVEMFDASESLVYEFNATVQKDTAKISVMYFDGSNISPMIGSYDID